MISCTRSILLLLTISLLLNVARAQQPSPTSSASRAIGTVSAVTGKIVSVKTDAGTETAVTVADSTRILKTAPGQKDLKEAAPTSLQDVQVGDRVLARGISDGTGSITATSLIVMKQSDVANRQQQDIQEWQRHGTGGIVRSVDSSSGAITVSTTPSQTVAVHTTDKTQFLRYPPDSVKFSDAKKSSFNEIKVGDQLRARGTRSSDGQSLEADAVISGTFRNIAGTVNSIDSSAGTITVMDLIRKKAAVVKVTSETQMRKIPPEVAQRIAMFLKRPAAAANNAEQAQNAPAEPGGGQQMRSGAGAGRPGGAPDFQQIIRRMPAASLTDLQKGDAVMIVTTDASAGEQPTALTLLSGVEPILTAAPSETSAANLLSGWSMGSGAEGGNQ
jgi:co-chaperonin GroES (HSP10)